MRFLHTIYAFLWCFGVRLGYGSLCTPAICQICCKATQDGCINAFNAFSPGSLVSNHLICQECNCDNPQIGCGWLGRRFKRVECSSCAELELMLQRNPNLPVAGCGKAIVDGVIVYTD